MQETLWLGNVRLLLALNHFAAANPDLYQIALLLSGPIADAFTIAASLLLWFWPQLKHRRQLQVHASDRLNPFAASWANLRTRWAMDTPREQSRAQFLAVIFAAALAYILVRIVVFEVGIARPFTTYLPLREGVKGTFAGLPDLGFFAADFAVLLAVLCVALWYWDRRLGIIWIGFSLVFSIARIAAGLNFPLDMIIGALAGVLFTKWVFFLYDKRGSFHAACHALARAFDLKNAPYCYLMVFLMILIALEFATRFEHVLNWIFALRGEIFSR